MSIHFSIRQLQVFLALADSGSISKAARACHVTQPTVSIQLRQLSESVGLPLYEVIGRRLTLTAAGEELARSARTMLAEWEAFSQRMDRVKGLTSGRLRVSVVSTAKYFIPRLLGVFCQRYPGVDVALEVLNRDGVLQRLQDNRDDLYIMSIPPKGSDIVRRAFLPNPLFIVGPARHRLAQVTSISLAQLAQDHFILREPGSGTRLAGDAHFRRYRFAPRVRLELGSNEAIKQAVAGGLGLAVLSRHALSAAPRKELLALLSVRHFPIHANWFVVYPKGKRLSPVASAFLQHLDSATESPTGVGPNSIAPRP
jgi:DNA-binding transcriptional LysR family regulator